MQATGFLTIVTDVKSRVRDCQLADVLAGLHAVAEADLRMAVPLRWSAGTGSASSPHAQTIDHAKGITGYKVANPL